MKFNFPINNLSSGEWSPKMQGRTDTDQYAKSCAELTNFIVQMTGGATYRGGTLNLFLLPATYAHLESVQGLPVGPQSDHYKLIPYTPFNNDNGKILIVAYNKWFVYPNVNTTSQEIAYGTNAAAAISSGKWVPSLIRYTVLGDLIILTQAQGYLNEKGSRPLVFHYDTATSTYRVDELERDFRAPTQPWKSVPFGPIETQGTSITLTPSATTGSITITASAAKWEVGGLWPSGDIGSYVRFGSGSSPDGVARITGVTSSTVATATVLKTLPATGAYGGTAAPTTFWQESAWSDRKGWPTQVVAHQARLIFGGSFSAPDTIWGSRISNYFNFLEVPSPDTTGSTGFANAAFTADNSRAFTLTPNSPEASAIVALSSGSTLTIHTRKSEIVAYGSNGALGPVNAVFESTTTYGSAPVQPARVNNFVTFVQATGRNVRDIVYNSDQEQFKSTDLAFVVDHYFLTDEIFTGKDPIVEMAKLETNSSTLWCRTATGRLYVVTLDRDYKVNAWCRVPLGGSGEADGYGNSHPHVLSLCSWFGGFSGDQMYVLVGRMLNGEYKVTLETFTPPWENSHKDGSTSTRIDIRPVYLDQVTPATKVSPLVWKTDFNGGAKSPFRNKVVSVVADGNYIGEFQVGDTDQGLIELPKEYETIQAGYKYKGRIITSPIEQGSQTGSAMGRIKRVNELVLRLVGSLGISYGRDGEMFSIPFRKSHASLDGPVKFFTGDKVVTFPPGYDRKYQLVIEQDAPYPCHVVSIVAQGTTYD